METTKSISTFSWSCWHTWQRSAVNTLWCLVGCSIGDFGTIFFFQVSAIPWSTLSIMVLAMANGVLTSIALETVILFKQMSLGSAFKTACGMSLISMLAMEAAMNAVDVGVTGGATLTFWVIPLMLLVGFLTPLPYNYWRLKARGVACH
jgi:hypothetical protein